MGEGAGQLLVPEHHERKEAEGEVPYVAIPDETSVYRQEGVLTGGHSQEIWNRGVRHVDSWNSCRSWRNGIRA